MTRVTPISRHAWKPSGGSWSFEKVEGSGSNNVGTYTSINVDSSHTLHISYYNLTSLNLKHAWKSSGGIWNTENVDSTGTELRYTSIAVEESGRVHISYYVDGSSYYDLRYARNQPGGTWVAEQVEITGAVGQYSSIALDSSGFVHIIYFDNTNSDLKHASRAANAEAFSAWTIESVDTGTTLVGSHCSFAIASDGSLLVGYYEWTNTGSSPGLKHAWKSGGIWHFEKVQNTPNLGQYTAIATDPSGTVHICYYDVNNRYLKYAWKPIIGSWTIETIDSGPNIVGTYYSSILVNSTGVVHVSYYDESAYDLKHAWKPSGGTWNREIVDSVNNVGQYSSIIENSTNVLHISYYDATALDLKHAYGSSGGTWNKEIVDSVNNIGQFTSTGVDSSGTLHISYYDVTNSDLKHAYKPINGTWSTEPVVTSGNNVGQFSKLLIDNSGTLHISYYDLTATDICHAYGTVGSWNSEIIESKDSVGQYSSMAQDSLGTIHVSYYNATSTGLMHAWKSSGAPSWSKQTVDAKNYYGQFSAIAVDVNGMVHISHYDGLGQDLFYSVGTLNGFSIGPISLSSGTNILTVTAYDAAGNFASDSITVIRDDVNPIVTISSPTSAANYYTQVPIFTLGGTSSDTNGISLVTWNNSRGGFGSASGTTTWSANIPLNYDKNVITVNAYDSSGRTSTDLINVYYAVQPTAPQNFMTGWGDGQVQLSWLPPASNGGSPITYYKVYRGTTSGSETLLTTVSVPTTQFISYTDTTIQNGQTYYYYVTAGNVVVEGLPSPEQDASPSIQFENFDASLIESNPAVMMSDIVVDSNGYVHICYISKGDVSTGYYHLKYATNASGTWTYRTVDSANNVGDDCQIAVDSSGQVHIVYHSSTLGTLKYVKGSGTTWGAPETIAPSYSSSGWSYSISIHLDSMDRPCVAYIDTSGYLHYTVKTGASWTTGTVIASNVVNVVSMDFDPSGYAHICYYNNTKSRLQYITNQGGSWSTPFTPDDYSVTGDHGVGLKVDSSGVVHIIYRRQSGSETQIFYSKRSAGGVWDAIPTLIDSRGPTYNENPDLEIDGSGIVHVVYGWVAQYATNQDGHWTWKSLESATSYYVRLALDQSGNPHIIFPYPDGFNYYHYPGPIKSSLIGGNGDHTMSMLSAMTLTEISSLVALPFRLTSPQPLEPSTASAMLIMGTAS